MEKNFVITAEQTIKATYLAESKEKAQELFGEDFGSGVFSILKIDENGKSDKMEIKISKATLPLEDMWCEIETREHIKIVAQYIANEEGFYPVNDDPKRFISIFDTHFWKPLKIDWEWKEWTERKENLATIIGSDDFTNDFIATGIIGVGLEIIEASDIEWVGQSSVVQ